MNEENLVNPNDMQREIILKKICKLLEKILCLVDNPEKSLFVKEVLKLLEKMLCNDDDIIKGQASDLYLIVINFTDNL